MIICSACLLGVNCRYDGGNEGNKKMEKSYGNEELIPVCPEQLGGMSTPREPSELQGDGKEVLDGEAKVITESGKDVTEKFIRGAKEVLKIVEKLNVTKAILKQRSPSCGYGEIYDGSFSGETVNGKGVTAAVLERNSVEIKTEEDL